MRKALLIFAVIGWYAPSVQAEEWYCVVWGWNNARGPVRPWTSHTCAAWVHVSGGKIIGKVEINWGPGGHRLIADSVEEARSRNLAIRRVVLGADAKFLDMAKKQRDMLRGYRFLDRPHRPLAVNCLHAVSDTAGWLDTGPLCGVAGSQRIADFFVLRGLARPSDQYWLANAIEEGR